MKKMTQFCFSSLLVATLFGCQTDANVSNVVTADSYTKSIPMTHAHGKQGAAVSLSNSKVSIAAAGVQYSIDLGIDSQYSSGEMEVAVSSSKGLYIVSGDTDIKETLTKGEFTFPFDVTATEEGRHYLYAVVSTESDGVKSSRALTMVVEVGQQDKTVYIEETFNKKEFSVKQKIKSTETTFGAPVLFDADEETVK